ncbi:MAG: hypothetical protein ACRDU4_10290 [Mycobacterium sp.]
MKLAIIRTKGGTTCIRIDADFAVEIGTTEAGAADVGAALRWENTRSGRSGWMPAVRGGWRKGVPAAERAPLTPTLPARVISQISYWSVPPEVITSLYSLGFVLSRAAT